jgi:hypothetical protein
MNTDQVFCQRLLEIKTSPSYCKAREGKKRFCVRRLLDSGSIRRFMRVDIAVRQGLQLK